MFHAFLLQILRCIAKTLIFVHRPYVIGVTGTVGKTTITSHVGQFLSGVFGEKNVRFSHEHYNGEYGLPLTIIAAKSGKKNLFLWIWVFIKGIIGIFLPFPKYLILEYGIDHPGEMDFLLSIVIPDIAILSEVAPNHLEQFGTFEKYRGEKIKLMKEPKHIIAHNSHKQYIDRDAVFYGIGAMSDVDISHVTINTEGTHARIHVDKTTHDISLPIFGAFHVENILPLYTISRILGINQERIALYLKSYNPQSGRSGILIGKGQSIIVDGSYNGGYLSIREGISSLLSLVSTHRIVLFLGDMRELGAETRKMHEMLANDINALLPHNADIICFLVGPYMQEYFVPIISKSFQVYTTLSSVEAGKSIAGILEEKDAKKTIIFVKGSQNTIFLEEGIIEFLEKKDDGIKLCRQSKEWKDKKKIFFEKLQNEKKDILHKVY